MADAACYAFCSTWRIPPVFGWHDGDGYDLMIKPIMRCIFFDAVDRCSLPCVRAADCGSGCGSFGRTSRMPLPHETVLAKEARNIQCFIWENF